MSRSGRAAEVVPAGLVGASLWTDSPRWAVAVTVLYALVAQPLQELLQTVAVAAGDRLAGRIRGGGGRSPPPPAG